MEFGVLGPVKVWTASGEANLGGARQRRLLAGLVLEAGEVASTDRLLDIVFEGVPPSGASTTIRSYIARLRRALGEAETGADELISTEQGGYKLAIDLDAVDASRFEASIETARGQLAERDPIGAAETLRHGLAMWRGEAYGEFTYEEWVRPEALRLEELRTAAEEELNEALLQCGLAHDVVSATRSQIERHPLRERLRRQHMLALYRAGRQVEALRSLEEFQQVLIDVGLEPSEEVLRLGRGIAAHDPALRLDSPAGQPLRGYRIGSALGEGAHGLVYRAVQPGVGREVAIKTIRAQLADNPAFIRRFDAEAQLVANLEHPHIVPIYDYWREPGGAYIVMRLLSDNLDTRLADGPMDAQEVGTLARQLGGALAAAHRAGVVHGDIKPSNVLVDGASAYLADFGVASLVESAAGDDSAYSSTGYESPELLAGQPASAATDQFALAVLLVQLLTGHLPFGTRAIATPHDRSPSIHVQRPSVPTPVDDVIWRATSWNPTDRYGDVATFIDHFEAALAGQAEPGPREREIVNPYRGLQAFSEVDRAVFFGRDAVVDELAQRFGRDGVDGRFVVAIGASGSGKSSVVRAGLLPRLRAGAVPGSQDWLIATMVPGFDPMGELEAAFRSIATGEFGPSTAEHEELDVSHLLERAVSPTQTVLLVIDQLEELFTQVADESARRRFIDGITRVVSRPAGNLRIVATLRADYLDRPLHYSEFGQLVKRGAVAVVGMSAPELDAAITRPAAGVGVEVEPALATQLVADVLDQPAALPLLQFTLTELFEQRSGLVLTLDGYHQLGGVDAAVAGRAEAVFGALTETECELARRMFLRLVTVDRSYSISRRRARRSDLVSVTGEPGSMDPVVDAFGASRLITFDHDHESREPTVEIAHEAMIDHWPRFAEWVARAGDGLRIQGQLTEAAREWDERGRDDGELYRGLRLESALEWADGNEEAVNPREREFLAAGVAARTATINAERAQAERDRRINRRLRSLLTGVGLLLIVAVVAGALAFRQQRRADDEAAAAREAAEEAERQTDVAVAAVEEADLATLISRSAAQSAQNPELSVLLALEAHRRSPRPETEQAVLNALGSSRIPNRVATFPGLDLSGCPTPVFAPEDGSRGYAHVGGRLVSIDFTTGLVTEHGLSDEECGVWYGDPESDRAVAGSADAQRNWVGSFDDPYAIQLEQTGQMWLLEGDLASGVAPFVIERGIDDDAVVLFDADTGEQIGEPIGAGVLRAFAVDPAGSFAAISHQDLDVADGTGRLRIVDAVTGDELHRIDTTAPAFSLTFDPTTLELMAGMADGAIMTVDLVTGEVVSVVATSATAEVGRLRARPDGLIVAVSEGLAELVDRRAGPTGVTAELRDVLVTRVREDGTIVTLRADSIHDVIELDGNALVERSWPIDPFARVAFNAGQAGLLNESSQDVALVDLTTGRQTEVELTDRSGNRLAVQGVYPEPDGVWAVAARGIMARWEGDTLVEQIDFPDRLFTWTRFEDRIAVLHSDGAGGAVTSLVNLEHGSAAILFTVPTPDGHSVHPALDGGLHVFDGVGTMHSYDANGDLVGQVETGAEWAMINTMDPTTGEVALGPNPGEVVVADPVTGEVQRLPGNDAVANLGFARDGQLLVISGFDGTVRVWDLERNEPAGLVWDGPGVRLASSPSWYDEASDSIWVFTGGRLLEVPLDPQRWIERACDVVGRDLTPEEWHRYVPASGQVEDPNGDSVRSGEPQSACL
jgi:DNA-binding SARP family transcriptional activator/tRNA A-37 threonylcarbamoyl transferase component Bud32/WD40 repeat protein